MTVIAALPKMHEPHATGPILTFIVPAAFGCDLRCAGCYIAQRGEDKIPSSLTPSDYASFIVRVARYETPALVTVQGYEALLPGSTDYTFAILDTAAELGLTTAIVTNGTHLEIHSSRLANLRIDALTVSLDSGSADRHDKVRGKAGAFAATVRGIRRAAADPWLAKRTIIASVLYPGRRQYLEDVPALLQDLGVDTWVVTPFLAMEHGSLEPKGDHHRIVEDLVELDQIARSCGIAMLADDEFECFLKPRSNSIHRFEKLRFRRLQRPDGVFRLLPDGSISVGKQILEAADTVNHSLWYPQDDPYPVLVKARANASPQSRRIAQ